MHFKIKNQFLRCNLYFIIVDYLTIYVFPFWSFRVQNLWFLLDKHQVPPQNGEEAMISYEAYLQVGEKAGPKCK